MRVTKGHSGHRRGHHALKTPRLSKCSNCGSYFQRHRVCQECGFYKGRKIFDFKKTEVTIADSASKKEVTTKKKKEISSSSKIPKKTVKK